jgi:predicted dehydrogenase
LKRITFVDGETFARSPTPGPPGNYPAYYAAAAAALRGQGANPVTPEQALAVMEVISAGEESARTRAEIRL